MDTKTSLKSTCPHRTKNMVKIQEFCIVFLSWKNHRFMFIIVESDERILFQNNFSRPTNEPIQLRSVFPNIQSYLLRFGVFLFTKILGSSHIEPQEVWQDVEFWDFVIFSQLQIGLLPSNVWHQLFSINHQQNSGRCHSITNPNTAPF